MKTLVPALLTAVLCALPAWAQPPDFCDVRLQRQASRQELRAEFIEQYRKKVFSTPEQNLRYKALVEAGAARVHITMGVGPLKALNTTLGNFDFVTALVNFQRELFIEEVGRLLPNVRFEVVDRYSDFKFFDLAFEADLDDDTLRKVRDEALARSVRRFDSHPLVRAIVRSGDLLGSWFSSGSARGSWDRANLANRFARRDSARPMRDFDDADVQEGLQKALADVKDLHMRALNRMRPYGLTEWHQLKLEVFAEARKAKTPEAFAAALSSLARAQVGVEDAALVLKCIRTADVFSPEVMVIEREHLTIEDAPFGAVALDFIGLGAENLRGTVKAVVEAADIDDAIRRARIEEQVVTARFEERKAMVREATLRFFEGRVSIRFSGDDGIIIPREQFPFYRQREFLQMLSALLPQPFFRMAILNAQAAASSDSSELVNHAEGVEKSLRALMRQQPRAGAPEMQFSVLNSDTSHERKLFLIVNPNRAMNHGDSEWLKKLFVQAAAQVEEDARRDGSDIRYEAVSAFSTFAAPRRTVGTGR